VCVCVLNYTLAGGSLLCRCVFCVCVCVCVSLLLTLQGLVGVCIWIFVTESAVRMHTYIFVMGNSFTHTHTHTFIHTYTHTHTNTHAHVRMHTVCTRVCEHVHMLPKWVCHTAIPSVEHDRNTYIYTCLHTETHVLFCALVSRSLAL